MEPVDSGTREGVRRKVEGRMYRIVSALSNAVLGAGGVLAVCFGIAGLVSLYLGSHGEAIAMADPGATLLASR